MRHAKVSTVTFHVACSILILDDIRFVNSSTWLNVKFTFLRYRKSIRTVVQKRRIQAVAE